jgi:hypothetical protein
VKEDALVGGVLVDEGDLVVARKEKICVRELSEVTDAAVLAVCRFGGGGRGLRGLFGCGFKAGRLFKEPLRSG